MSDLHSVSPVGHAAAPLPARRNWLTALGSGWRLSTRIVVMSLGLLLLVQATGYGLIQASIERNARNTLATELAVGARVWRRLLDQRVQGLTQGATMLAADEGFRSALATPDQDSLRARLASHGARAGASLTALLDPSLALRAVGQNADGPLQAALLRLPQAMGSRNDTVAIVGGQAYQFVMVPVKAQALLGWIVMGVVVDQTLVDDMRMLSGLHAAVVVARGLGASPSPGDAGTLALSSLPVQAQQALAGRAQAQSRQTQVPMAERGAITGELNLGGAPWMARSQRVDGDSGGTVHVVVLRALADAVAPFAELQMLMALVTVAGLALFGMGSVWTARRVARPLQALVLASERLAGGDYDHALTHTARRDEIGELARALDHMRQNIGQQRSEIHRLAYWDRLTMLPNRLQFRDALAQAIAQAELPGPAALAQADQLAPQLAPPRSAVTVLMLDLDRFKHVNDVLGHAFGDRLLCAVTARLKSVAREGDMVARLGSDEFALLLPQSDVTQALGMARRIVTSFERALRLDDHMVDLSAGIGIASWPAQALDADTLLSHAEAAMYTAKRRSAGAQVYDPGQANTSEQSVSLLSELRHALEFDELRLYLQPKIDLRGGQSLGAEALVRWQHPVRGLVPPVQFVPFAEQTGFIRQVTLWMFAQVARQQAVLRGLGITRVSINLSTRDLLDQDLPDKLDALLRQYGAQAQGLCLEITESAMMDDPKRAEATLNRLAERGFSLSIDDFGTGYSSLAYLKRLPVDELKIDRSFVMGMARSPDDANDDAMIVRSTIDLAHNLGLTVVAEGVETAAVLAQLALLNCDEAQGYHIARPMPMADIPGWVTLWNARRPAATARSLVLAPPAALSVAAPTAAPTTAHATPLRRSLQLAQSTPPVQQHG